MMFDEFFSGFNQANRRFLMVDVGRGKEMADTRMRCTYKIAGFTHTDTLSAYLEDYCRMPSTWKIIFGGCHDNGYALSVQSLITTGLKEKIVLLPSYAEMAAAFKSMDLPTLVIGNLFRPDKIVTVQAPSSPVLSSQRPAAMSTNGTWGIPGSPPKSGLKVIPQAVAASDAGGFTVVPKAKQKVSGQKKLTLGLVSSSHT